MWEREPVSVFRRISYQLRRTIPLPEAVRIPRLHRVAPLGYLETVTVGTNELVGTDASKLRPVLGRLMAGEWKRGAIPDKWDGAAARRSVAELERFLT